MNAKLSNPDYIIFLKDLYEPVQIMNFCQNNRIKNYAYAFVLNLPNSIDSYLKIGRSAGNEAGERIYRQSGHIPGWNKMLIGPAGSDIKFVIGEYIQHNPQHKNLLTKDNISLRIWDVTNGKNPHMTDYAYLTRVCENQLLEDHEKVYGELPIGNPKDTRNEKTQPFVHEDHWNNLFVANDNEEVDTVAL